MRACDHAGRPEGVALVTNTEQKAPYDGLNALESTVYGRFEAFPSMEKHLYYLTPPFRRTSSLPATRGEREEAVSQGVGCREDIGLILRVLVLFRGFVA